VGGVGREGESSTGEEGSGGGEARPLSPVRKAINIVQYYSTM